MPCRIRPHTRLPVPMHFIRFQAIPFGPTTRSGYAACKSAPDSSDFAVDSVFSESRFGAAVITVPSPISITHNDPQIRPNTQATAARCRHKSGSTLPKMPAASATIPATPAKIFGILSPLLFIVGPPGNFSRANLNLFGRFFPYEPRTECEVRQKRAELRCPSLD